MPGHDFRRLPRRLRPGAPRLGRGAETGAAWVDLVLLLPSVAMQGGPEPDTVFRSRRVSGDAPADAVDAVLAAVAGYFTRQSLLPAPPNLPTLRPFQAAQGVEARRWLAHRLGWH